MPESVNFEPMLEDEIYQILDTSSPSWDNASMDRKGEIVLAIVARLENEAPLLFAEGIATDFVCEHEDIVKRMSEIELEKGESDEL